MKISCLICAYNTDKKFLKECIESLLNQQYPVYEILIVDDNSEYDVKTFIRETFINNEIIKVFRNDRNEGVAYSRNKLFSLATGDVFAIMDSDDKSTPDRMLREVNYLKSHKRCNVVSSQMIVFDETGILYKTNIRYPKSDRKAAAMLFWDNGKTFLHGPAMLRREFIMKNSIKYGESYKKASDYSLWVNCALFSPHFKLLKEYLYFYRVHGNQITTKGKNDQIFYSNRICLDQLSKFGIVPTAEEEKIHLSIKDAEPNYSLSTFYCWCKRLIKSNKDSRIFCHSFFKTEVKYRMLKIVKKSKEHVKKIPYLIWCLSPGVMYKLCGVLVCKILRVKNVLIVNHGKQ